jgi:hypothetical protein
MGSYFDFEGSYLEVTSKSNFCKLCMVKVSADFEAQVTKLLKNSASRKSEIQKIFDATPTVDL